MDVETSDIVAIDGPAGAGKSTVARIVAQRLGYAYLDTGAMYRAVTLRVMKKGIDWNNRQAIVDCARTMDLRLEPGEKGMRVWLDGEDVTEAIRTPEVTKNIYRVDEIPEVRAHLVDLQRDFGKRHPTVAEGRDMGTIVFPRAKCKIFLDASLDERTKRRAKELSARGVPVDFEQLRKEIQERDEKNRNRAASPLKPAEDAIYLDSSSLTVDEVVSSILTLARKAGLSIAHPPSNTSHSVS